MNFFAAQDNARRNSWRLAALFLAAVICLIIMTNLLVAAVYLWTGNYALMQTPSITGLLAGLPTEHWLAISTGVVGVIAIASLVKYLSLRGGGRAVAEAMGGKLISRQNPDAAKQRLLNVVEEMAIAAGISVPPVYLIPELSINAFAAGYSPDDAVIGINQGTLEHLNRDELQGVIGHEFSHILNGDTRINLRLIAILHGILFIGIIGYSILRGVGRGGRRSNSSGGLAILALGLGLLVIGYAGTFFGNLIKAAVSRQREYLADAAAVQFTRNPAGIANALKRIGGLSYGSSMTSAAANEASHMLFAQSRNMFLNRMLSTHPPLEQRILAVDPSWNGQFTTPDHIRAALATPSLATQGQAFTAQHPTAGNSRAAVTAEQVTVAVGQLDQQALDNALAIIGSTEASLREAAHDPWTCRGLVHAMLLAQATTVRDLQLEILRANAEPCVHTQVQQLAPLTDALDEPHKLILVEMSIAALKELSRSQYQQFIGNVIASIKADSRVDLFEWVLHRLLIKELQPHFEGPVRVRARYTSLHQVADASATVLSALAREQADAAGRTAAFRRGLQGLGISSALDAGDDANFSRLDDAISTLRQLKPLAKPKLIKACAAVALADGHLSPRQGALLQGIAAALDCPLPPSIYTSA